MPILEHLDTFEDIRDQYLVRMAPGIAFHAMLFPRRYPSGRTSIAARIKDPELPSPVLEEYGPETLSFLAAGILIQRLAVVYGPDDSTNFDREYVRLLKQEYTQLQAQEIEEVRVTWYSRFLSGLQKECGDSSPFAKAYSQGIQEDNPKVSFWASYPVSCNTTLVGWQEPAVVCMQYYQNQEFAGATVYSLPFSPDLGRFVHYSRATFDDPVLSANINELQV